MKIIFSSLIGILSLVGSSLYGDVCDDFKASVSAEVTINDLSSTAGNEVEIPITIIIDPGEAKNWLEINIMTSLFNEVKGSKGLFETYVIKTDQSELNLPKKLKFKTSENMAGGYYAGIHIYALSLSYPGLCRVRINKFPNFKISIKNDPEKIDIDPPTISGINFKKNTYKASETLEILFKAEDKSKICTIQKANDDECNLGTHVKLVSLEGNDEISLHTPTPIFKTKEKSVLLAVVPLSEEHTTEPIKPGVYKLVNFMFKDIYNNYFDELPTDSLVTVEIIR